MPLGMAPDPRPSSSLVVEARCTVLRVDVDDRIAMSFARSIRPSHDLAEILAETRDNPSGLVGYVIGRDWARATTVAQALDVGIVGVNNAAPNMPRIPFSGLKLGGLGTEGGDSGLDAFPADQAIAVAQRTKS